MKRTDIKPGTVYAYSRGDRYFDPVQAVIILDTKLYTNRRYSPHGITEAAPGARPSTRGLGMAGGKTGYLALFGPSGTLATLDWAQLYESWKAAGVSSDVGTLYPEGRRPVDLPEGVEFKLIAVPVHIRGEYWSVVGARKERAREVEELQAARERTLHERDQRIVTVTDALRKAGLPSAERDTSRFSGVRLSTDDAEQLAAILAAVRRLPGNWRGYARTADTDIGRRVHDIVAEELEAALVGKELA